MCDTHGITPLRLYLEARLPQYLLLHNIYKSLLLSLILELNILNTCGFIHLNMFSFQLHFHIFNSLINSNFQTLNHFKPKLYINIHTLTFKYCFSLSHTHNFKILQHNSISKVVIKTQFSILKTIKAKTKILYTFISFFSVKNPKILHTHF